MDISGAAPQTLAELATLGGIPEANLVAFSASDVDDLCKELGVRTAAWVINREDIRTNESVPHPMGYISGQPLEPRHAGRRAGGRVGGAENEKGGRARGGGPGARGEADRGGAAAAAALSPCTWWCSPSPCGSRCRGSSSLSFLGVVAPYVSAVCTQSHSRSVRMPRSRAPSAAAHAASSGDCSSTVGKIVAPDSRANVLSPVRKAFQAAPWAETAGGARNTTPRSNLAGSLCQLRHRWERSSWSKGGEGSHERGRLGVREPLPRKLAYVGR
jgi:hypothetical protein